MGVSKHVPRSQCLFYNVLFKTTTQHIAVFIWLSTKQSRQKCMGYNGVECQAETKTWVQMAPDVMLCSHAL